MSTEALSPTTKRSRTRRGSKSSSSSSSPLNSCTKFPSIVIPRPTLISPDFSDLNPHYRINVLHPPSVPRRTVAMETGRSHLHVSTRTLDMQRREAEYRSDGYRIAMYGTPSAKALYKSDIRSTLKGQMAQHMQNKKDQFNSALDYSIRLFERDRQVNMDDSQKRHEKLQFLLTFTRANQKAMDDQKRERRERKTEDDRFERELLKINPINWSHTLK